MPPDQQTVEFLTAEYNNQYEQFRHQDVLRIHYLQIYFSLATVLLAGTGIALSGTTDNLPMLLVVAIGYLFMFYVGQMSVRMMASLRVTQLTTAVLLDLIRTRLGDGLGVSDCLLYAGSMRSHPFYDAKASSTWVYRFISVLNGVFATGAAAFAMLAASTEWEFGIRAAVSACVVIVVAGAVTTRATLQVNTGRLRKELLEAREGLDLDSLYDRLHTDLPRSE